MTLSLEQHFSSLILPPGIFIVAIFSISVAMIYRRRWKLGLLNLFVGLILWTLSTAPVAHFLIQELEAGQFIPKRPTGDVVILFGDGPAGLATTAAGMAPLAPTMEGMRTALRLQQMLAVPVIVRKMPDAGDASLDIGPTAKRILVEMGVPEKAILEEGRARDSGQAARLIAGICRQRGFSRPVLLAAAYQMRRARLAFDTAGLPVIPFPTDFLSAPGRPFAWRHLLPEIGSLVVSTQAIYEHMAIFYHRMT